MSENCRDNNGHVVDYAIVGAGCSGLYCAWRLLNATNPPSQLLIFERDRRVGGRLLSLSLLKKGRMAELGGMRFTDTQVLINELVRTLRKELGVSDDDKQHELNKDPFKFDTRYMYLRARNLRPEDADWATNSTYSLKCQEKNFSEVTVAVAKYAISEALKLLRPQTQEQTDSLTRLNKNLTKSVLNPAEWRDLQQNVLMSEIDRRLYEVGFWNLLQRCLDTSDFLFLHDALGYESLLANSNAALAIPNFLADFDNPEYFTLTGGMESLPRILLQQCKEKSGFEIAKQHSVKKITLMHNKSGGTPYFSLDVECKPEPDATSSHLGPGPHCARNVILALPKEALKQIQLVGFGDDKVPRFCDSLENVKGHPAFKLFLRYNKPWWYQDLGCLDAKATTDLPIRQVYYIGDSSRGMGEKTGAPASDDEGLLMASYSDEHYVDFWDPLVKDGLYTPAKPYGASPRLLDKIQRQIRSMHERSIQEGKLNEIPEAEDGYVQEWEQAWHFWNVHTKPWKAAEGMIRPFDSLNLFTCGEAYSLEQGWIEGALKSAERVLKELMIDKPRFFDLNKYPKVNCKKFDEYIEN